MRVGKLGTDGTSQEEWEALSSPLDEILRRLDAIERRLARLEADALAPPPRSEASNAADFADPPPRASEPLARPKPPNPAPAPAAPVATSAASEDEPRVAAGDDPKSYSPTATAPATERLRPISPAPGEAPFPDLSLLDEKLAPRRGPALKIDAKAAIEDYPRICSRIQQLWGTPECEGYLNNLVIDTRGNRKGFPPAVVEELLYLGRLSRALVILGIDGDLWDSYDQIGDRR